MEYKKYVMLFEEHRQYQETGKLPTEDTVETPVYESMVGDFFKKLKDEVAGNDKRVQEIVSKAINKMDTGDASDADKKELISKAKEGVKKYDKATAAVVISAIKDAAKELDIAIA